jgi:hypothetical protein
VKGAGKSAAVYHQVLGTGASQRLVIQWNSISYDADQAAKGGAKGGLTFQAVLFADGSIRFNYQSLATGKNGGANDLGKSATVGIKDAGPQGPNRLLLLLNGSTPSLVGSNKSVQITRGSANPDLYSFSLTAGDTATVAVKVVSAGTVNVDLLNPAGTVVASAVAGPTNLDKVISNFAVTTTGTYRARVTGNGIIQYNLLATRNAALDAELNDTYATAQDITGRHGVIGHVAAGSSLFHLTGTPVAGDLVLAGSKLTLGINPDGSFITGGTGIQFLGNEFVVPGSPVAGFTIGQAGTNYTNKAALGTTDIGVTLEDLSSGTLRGVRIVGTVGGSLLMERVIVFNQDDEFATIATRLTNTSGATIDNVAWLENLDPDQGEPLGFDFVTFNDVVLGGAFVRADAQTIDYPGGLTIGLGSADTRRVVSAEGFDNRNPYEIITSPVDPNGSSDDIGINLAFDFGTLAAGQSAAGTMIMTFGRTTAEADATYTSHTAGTLVADEDWYKMTVGTDGILHVETSTPGSGPGEPGNTLNPHIEVFGTSPTTPLYVGTPLDGRNEVVHVTGLTPGAIYRIRVTGEAGTRGEYFLDPPIQTAPALPAQALTATSSPSRKAAPPGKSPTANLLASAALLQKRTASQRPLEVQSVDVLFASTNRAGSTTDWYGPQPQAEVADSLLDLVATSLSPGKKGNARARR